MAPPTLNTKHDLYSLLEYRRANSPQGAMSIEGIRKPGQDSFPTYL